MKQEDLVRYMSELQGVLVDWFRDTDDKEQLIARGIQLRELGIDPFDTHQFPIGEKSKSTPVKREKRKRKIKRIDISHVEDEDQPASGEPPPGFFRKLVEQSPPKREVSPRWAGEK